MTLTKLRSTEATVRGRILVAKLGLDGHDVGAKVVSRILLRAGFDVIYLGIRQTPELVAVVARDEDVDVIGISMLSGAHLALVPRLMALVGTDPTSPRVVVGGSIPDADIEALEGVGVAAVFSTHASSASIIEVASGLVRARREPVESTRPASRMIVDVRGDHEPVR